MHCYGPDDLRVFSRIEKTIAENAKRMIFDLNDNWRILGVDDVTRHKRTENLVAFVQERYDEVVEETAEKVKSIQTEIKLLRDEFSELTVALNVILDTQYDKESTLTGKRNVLEKDLDGLRKLFKVRKDKISKLNDRHQRLCLSLGTVKSPLPISPLPCEESIAKFEALIKDQKEKYEKRIKFFVEKQQQIKALTAELELDEYDSFHHYILESSSEDFSVTDSNMSQLVIVHDTLEEKFQARVSEILKMREHLQSLWERLMEPTSHRTYFLTQYTGNSRATEKALAEEINRCEEMKRENFKLFLEKLRCEIIEMWDKCYYSEMQRDKFVDFAYDDEYDESIITNHEEYLQKLKGFYEDNINIFTLYESRQNLWQKWDELEEKSHEKNRYHNRGGQLLKEEKERKAVSNQLPKIEKELEHLAEKYEEANGVEFTINGVNLIEIMKEDWEKKNVDKLIKASARKQLNLPRTPISVPRSAPASRLLPLMNKETLTAIKRRLSPRNSPHSSKYTPSISRRLQFTPKVDSTGLNRSLRSKKDKSAVPTLAVNGCILKKKRSIGRLSQDSKGKKRSRKSKTPSKPTGSEPSLNSTTYIDFQEHIHNDINSRSSAVVRERNLRPRNQTAETNKYKPDGKTMNLEVYKENFSPKNSTKNRSNAASVFGTPAKSSAQCEVKVVDGNVKYNVNVFATPSRPLSKSNKINTLHRQNTVLLASPSVYNSSRPLRRSNSSHNLKSVTATSYSSQSPKIKFTSKLDLIM